MKTVTFAMLGWPEISAIVLIGLFMLALLTGAIFVAVWFANKLSRKLPPVISPTAPTASQCPRCGSEIPGDRAQGLCPRCVFAVGIGTQTGSMASAEQTSAKRPPPSREELAPHFPQLEILELIGQGGMGAVYKARQKELDRLVALKVLPTGSARDPAFAERFSREARALARLSHPNIVTVHESGQAGGFFFFVMEFVDGLNLRQTLRAQRLAPREAMAIVPQICEALQYAHDQGIVHRDIKPENVLLDKQGRVKIADFGLAKLLGVASSPESITRTRDVMGTPHYMAPEQIEHPTEVDHRADIYSLGVVFYEMLTGELPLGRFAVPSKKVQVDVRLDEIVLRALEKEPELRFQQASQLQTQVETVAEMSASGNRSQQSKPSAQPSGPPLSEHASTARTWTWRRPLLRAAAVAFVTFLFMIAAAMMTEGLLPMRYSAQAKLLIIERNPRLILNALEWIKSPDVLEQVITELDLAQRWAGLRGANEPMLMSISRHRLYKQINLRNLRNSGVIHIDVSSSDPSEPAAIANKLFELIATRPEFGPVRLIEQPGPGSAWRRQKLIFDIGAAGIPLGLIAGGLALFFSWLKFRNKWPVSEIKASQAVRAHHSLSELSRGDSIETHWVTVALQTAAIHCALIMLLLIWAVVMAPKFMAVFADLGYTLPAATQVSAALAGFLQHWWGLLIPVGVGLDCAAGLFATQRFGKRGLQLWSRVAGTALAVLLAFMAVTLVWPFGLAWVGGNPNPTVPWKQQAASGKADKSQAQTEPSRPSFFGPVIERELVDSKIPFTGEAERTNALMMIDFDSGSLFSGPLAMWETSPQAQKRWMQTNGIDALCVVPKVGGLVGLDMKAVPVEPKVWDAIPVGLFDQLLQSEVQDTILVNARESMPPTWLFQTREGGMGLLQITGFPENPPGVKIRYKLALTFKETTNLVRRNSALQFRLVAEPNSDTPADEVVLRSDPTGQQKLRVLKEVLLDDSAVLRAGWSRNPISKAREISVRFTSEGAQRFHEITTVYVKRQIAIVFRGQLLSAPRINEPIGSHEIAISGALNDAELHEIINALNRRPTISPESWKLETAEAVLPLATSNEKILLDLDTERWATNQFFRMESVEAHEWARSYRMDLWGAAVVLSDEQQAKIGAYQTLIGQITSTRESLDKLLLRYTDDSPPIVAARQRLKELVDKRRTMELEGPKIATTNIGARVSTVVGHDLLALPADAGDWEALTAADVFNFWPLSENAAESRTILHSTAAESATWLFRTREGGKGLLRIAGRSDDPLGVRIRYKLVRVSAAEIGGAGAN